MEERRSVKIVGFWVSPFVHRVRWALKLKGVEYEYIEEDVFNRSPLLSQVNPVYGKVPVLIHNGKPLPESTIILEYIDETWKHNPLMPQDPFKRAQARFWGKFVDEKILDAIRMIHGSEGERQDKGVGLAFEALEKLEQNLDWKKYFGGDEIGYLDLIIGFASYMFPVVEEVSQVKILDPMRFPGLAAWKDNFLNHPAIQAEYLPSKDEMIPHFQSIREKRLGKDN